MSDVITTFSSCSYCSRLIRDDGHAETRVRCGDDWEYIKRISADDHGCWGPGSPIGGDDGRRRPRDTADDQRLCIRQLHCICQLKARSHSHMYSLELKSEGADWSRSWTGIKVLLHWEFHEIRIYNIVLLYVQQESFHQRSLCCQNRRIFVSSKLRYSTAKLCVSRSSLITSQIHRTGHRQWEGLYQCWGGYLVWI